MRISDAGEDAGQPPGEAGEDGFGGRVGFPRPVLVGRTKVRLPLRQPRVLRLASESLLSLASASCCSFSWLTLF